RPLRAVEWAGGVSWARFHEGSRTASFHTTRSRDMGAVEKEDDVETLLEICHNLVVQDKQQNVVRFAHFSVREFLQARLDGSYEIAAGACLSILKFAKPLLPATPITEYAL